MVLWVIVALSLVVSMADGLCMPEHVQTQFCDADYVMRVRVLSSAKLEVPDLPPRPTVAEKPKTRPTDRKNDNETKKTHTLGVAPVRHPDPAPAPLRSARSISVSPVGWRYQEVKIKRILKGNGVVQNTVKTEAQLRSNSRSMRYKSQLYVSPSLQLKPGKAYILAGKIIENRLYLSRCNWYLTWSKLSLSQIRGLKKNLARRCKCRVQFCYLPGCENIKAKGACMWRPQGYYPVDDCRYHHSLCRVHKGNCEWIDNDEYRKCMKSKSTTLP